MSKGHPPGAVRHQSLSSWPRGGECLAKVTQHAVVRPAVPPVPPSLPLRAPPPPADRPTALCLESVQSPREGQGAGVGLGVSAVPFRPPPWLSDFLDWIQFPGRAETCQAFSSNKPSRPRVAGMVGANALPVASNCQHVVRTCQLGKGQIAGRSEAGALIPWSVCGCPKRGPHASPSQTRGIKN